MEKNGNFWKRSSTKICEHVSGNSVARLPLFYVQLPGKIIKSRSRVIFRPKKIIVTSLKCKNHAEIAISVQNGILRTVGKFWKFRNFFEKVPKKWFLKELKKKSKVIPSTRNPYRGNGRVENGIGGVNKGEQNYWNLVACFFQKSVKFSSNYPSL